MESRKKYWLFGPLVRYQEAYYMGDFYFAGYSYSLNHPFFSMTEKVGDEHLLIPEKLKIFAQRIVDDYYVRRKSEQDQRERLQRIVFTHRA